MWQLGTNRSVSSLRLRCRTQGLRNPDPFPDKIDEIADLLDDSLFYDPPTGRYSGHPGAVPNPGKISYTQVYTKLRKDKEPEAPEELLIGLTQSFISQAELRPSVEVLREKAGKRRILQAAHQIEEMILLERRRT